MEENSRLDAVEYLDRFFDELRDEVRANPQLAGRLVRALGAEVVFDDADAGDTTNPYVLAANGSKTRFYAVYAAMKTSQLKRILRDNNLATSVDIRGKTPGELVDMMFERASSKVVERKTSAL